VLDVSGSIKSCCLDGKEKGAQYLIHKACADCLGRFVEVSGVEFFGESSPLTWPSLVNTFVSGPARIWLPICLRYPNIRVLWSVCGRCRWITSPRAIQPSVIRSRLTFLVRLQRRRTSGKSAVKGFRAIGTKRKWRPDRGPPKNYRKGRLDDALAGSKTTQGFRPFTDGRHHLAEYSNSEKTM